jgi:hypothetical protein
LEVCAAPRTTTLGGELERLAWLVRCYQSRNDALRAWYADVRATK